MLSLFSRKKGSRAKLKKVLRSFDLPSFPAAIMETLQKIRHPNSAASNIAGALSMDPGLSVQVLRMANSAAFSPTRKVDNLTQAIALIGLSQIESMVLSVGSRRISPAESYQGFDSKRFWRASAKRAVLSRELAAIVCSSRQSECFTAGFLQDMALPFLAANRSDDYGPLLERWHSQGGDLASMEQEAFDWDHAEVAIWMCSEWEFPDNITSSIATHHGSRYEDVQPTAPVAVVSILGETNDQIECLLEQARELCGIQSERMQEIIDSSFEKADEISRLLT